MYSRPVEPTLEWIDEKFAGKELVISANKAAFKAGHAFGETAELGEPVGVAAATTSEVIPLRIADKQPVLRSGHCHVQQPSLLLDLLVVPGRHVGGDVAVGGMDHEARKNAMI